MYGFQSSAGSDSVIWATIPAAAILYALVMGILGHRAKARAERVRLLEEALKNPAIDRATLDALAEPLSLRRSRPAGSSRLMAVVLAAGWLGLFVGVGLWIAGATGQNEDQLTAGILTAVCGFGLVTYPFALAELQGRRAPS